MGTRAFCVLGGGGICLVATLMAAAPGDNRRAWEYKFLTTQFSPSDPAHEGGPNTLGPEGWELVSATADSQNKYVLYFKRPKQAAP